MSTAQTAPHAEVHSLYSDHHGWLRSWLRRRMSCPHGAADVAHDTFCRLLAMPDSSRRIDEPRAFLVTTATRLLIDQTRRARIERAYLETLAVLQADACAPSAQEHQEAVEALLAVAALLAEMPPKLREVLLLSRCEELPQADIAQKLGTSVRMVKHHLAQAMLHCYAVVHGAPPVR